MPWSWSRRACLLVALCALSAAPRAAEGTPSESLEITGAVKNRLVLKLADLQAMAAGAPAQNETRHVDGKDVAVAFRGVPLTAVLDRAALADGDRNDWKHAVVVASGTDGYAVTFSWSELFNTEVGPSVFVVFERDGKPLGERDGRFALAVGKDLHNGPRNVHWLSRLDVRVLQP